MVPTFVVSNVNFEAASRLVGLSLSMCRRGVTPSAARPFPLLLLCFLPRLDFDFDFAFESDFLFAPKRKSIPALSSEPDLPSDFEPPPPPPPRGKAWAWPPVDIVDYAIGPRTEMTVELLESPALLC